MPGGGPTWLIGYAESCRTKRAKKRLVATYHEDQAADGSIRNRAVRVERRDATISNRFAYGVDENGGDAKASADAARTSGDYRRRDGEKWVLFGDPLPTLGCPATFEAWQDPSKWEVLKPQETLQSAADGKPVKPAAWLDCVECVSQAMGDGVYADVRQAVGVRRSVVRGGGFAVRSVGTRR